MSLKTLEKIRVAREKRPEELAEAREKGAKVCGYFGAMIPEEILHGMGIIPVRLGIGGDERLVELGSRYISSKNCAFIRESMGMVIEKENSFIKNSDIVAVAGTCMQMYRMSELIKYYSGIKTIALGVPKNFDLPEGVEYFRMELEDFTKQLEGFTGEKLDEAHLKKSIKLYKNIRENIRQLYRHLSMYDSPISWRDIFATIHAGFFLDRGYFLSLLRELTAELNNLPPEDRGKTDGAPRIMLSGSKIAPGDTKLIDLIDEMGGKIVADDLCTGARFHKIPTPREYSIHGIADAYIGRASPDAALPYLSLETDRRLNNVVQMIADYKVDGLIYHTLRYCDPYTFKANETKKALKGSVPFLEIHTEYATTDTESLRTRVEAFFELLSTTNKGGRPDVNQLQNVS